MIKLRLFVQILCPFCQILPLVVILLEKFGILLKGQLAVAGLNILFSHSSKHSLRLRSPLTGEQMSGETILPLQGLGSPVAREI